MFLETTNGNNSLLLLAIQIDDEIKYCAMDMAGTDFGDLSGFVTADFDADGLLDIAGFN